jgi:hypothetical protein
MKRDTTSGYHSSILIHVHYLGMCYVHTHSHILPHIHYLGMEAQGLSRHTCANQHGPKSLSQVKRDRIITYKKVGLIPKTMIMIVFVHLYSNMHNT